MFLQQPESRRSIDDQFKRSDQEKVIIFIDGANLFYAALALSINIDYLDFLKNLVGSRTLVRAYFYTGVDSKNVKQRGFLQWMKLNDYRLVTREVVTHADGQKTANLDVEIAVDMVNLAQYCDTLILVSGDGDLSYAMKRASQQGARCEVVSLRSMTSESLLDVADHYRDLEELI